MATVTEYSMGSGSFGPNNCFIGSDGLYWVPAGTANSNVLKFALDGTRSDYTIGTSKTWYGGCKGPDNNVWVCGDTTSAGTATTSGGSSSTPATNLSTAPRGMCTGPDGNMWVACWPSSGTGAINRLKTDGTRDIYTTGLSASAKPSAICSDGTDLWFSIYNATNIGKCTTGGTITEYALPASTTGCLGACLGNDGNLWFCGLGSPAKIIKSTTGGVTSSYNAGGGGVLVGICVGPDGLLWFGERSRSGVDYVVRMDYSGNILQSIATTTNNNGGVLGVESCGGYVWYSTVGASGNKVGRISPDYPPPRKANARQAVTRAATR